LGEISSINFSNDDKRIFTSSIDGTIKVWNASNGYCTKSVQAENWKQINQLALSSDGKQIFVASDLNEASGIDSNTFGQNNKFIGHVDEIFSI